MKILMVTPEYPPDTGGGILRYARDLCQGLKAHGCEVDVLRGSAFTHGGSHYESDGIEVATLETYRLEQWHRRFGHFSACPRLRRDLAAAFALQEQANSGKGYDAVEVTDWGLLFVPWLMSAQAPVLVQAHGSSGQIAMHEPETGRAAEAALTVLIERASISAAPAVSAYSRHNEAFWKSAGAGRVHYLPPPLALPRDEKPVHATGAVSRTNWLAVGRIQHWKGPQVACEAWARLGSAPPPLRWLGRDVRHGATGGSTDAWLSNQFPRVWRRSILPVGSAPPERVLREMTSAKAVLVPSLWDTFNLGAAEAMALGKAVVVSDGAGAADLVEHGVNGFIFPAGDAGRLAELVREVNGMSEAELDSIGRAASDTVTTVLDPARISLEKLSLYRSLRASNASDTSWLESCVFSDCGSDDLGFLDAQPLRALCRYVMRRGFDKVFARQRR
ncbi:MAG: glycosyltransferase family 4 protein [Acidobacteria bacterium]|nr:glycosyltransferase family 4 protein [Acidobacteriota bacterium]